MKIEELIIGEDRTVIDAMHQLDSTGHRILFIAPDCVLKAVVTDSDIRRFIIGGGSLSAPVSQAATYHPHSLPLDERRRAKAYLIEKSIDALPLLDKTGRIVDVEFIGDLDVDARGQLDLPVVMMAGGLGTRLYPYTKILPKPLIPVGELPIAEQIINRFRGFGCTRFYLVVNYRKNMIKSYFADVQDGYHIEYADEDKPLGTGGGLALLKGKLDRTFFFTNCDNLIDADYADIYKYHRKNNNVITMICAFQHTTIPYGVVELGRDGKIARMTEKPEMNYLTNTGVYLVEPCVVEAMQDNHACGFPDIINEWRAKGANVGVYPVSEGAWMDMGQMEALEDMRRRLENT